MAGKTNALPPHSSVTKSPLEDNKTFHNRNNSAMRNSRRGMKEAWRNSSGYDFTETVGPSRQRVPGHEKTAQLSQKRVTSAAEFDDAHDLAGSTSYAAVRSEFDRRRQAGAPVRTGHHSGTRTYPGQLDSDRSLTSSASLGAQIVTRSRQNLRLTSSKGLRTSSDLRPASGKAMQRTSGSGTRKMVDHRDRDLSPSGLVLEGCRVPLRPSTASSHDTRPTSAVARFMIDVL